MKIPLRLLFLVWTLVLAVGAEASFAASPVDPFLEKFRVGAYRDMADVAMAGAWPAEMWLPLVNAPDEPSEALRSFPELAAATRIPGSPRAVRDGLVRGIFEAVTAGDTITASAMTMELGVRADELGLPAEDRFVWRLRSLQLAGRDVSMLDAPWSHDAGLGPWDSRSAWILWCLCRDAAGVPRLPDRSPTADLARHLAAVGGGMLPPSELAGLRCDAGIRAGLGAAVLEDRRQLTRHFDEYSDLPTRSAFQSMWLDGKRRLAGYAPDETRALASLDGLDADLRLDLLRRASEAYVLRERWEEGLAAFETAVAALDGDRLGRTRKRFAEWCGQLLALCDARGYDERRARIFDHLDARPESGGDLTTAIERETAQWRPGGVACASTGVIRLDEAAARVRNGGAAPFSARHDVLVDDVTVAVADSMWGMWTRWGIALCAKSPTGETYAADLGALRSRATEGGWPTAAAAAIDARLSRSPSRFDIALLLEITPRTGFPRLARTLRDSGDGWLLDAHATLGVALLLGDGRGIMSLTMLLPQSVLSLDERLHFLYPLPPAGDLAAAVDGCGVEAAAVLAVARNESGFDPSTRSRAGALGWMQIMPLHYPENGFIDGAAVWRDPLVSLETGSRLLRENDRRYRGDPYRTIAAYNAGGTAVDRWERQLGGEQPAATFLAWIGYPETRRYVEKVLIDREIYDWILTKHSRP